MPYDIANFHATHPSDAADPVVTGVIACPTTGGDAEGAVLYRGA